MGNAEIRGGTVYLGKDALGSVRGATNDYGLLEERYEYDAFGKPYKGDLNSGMNLGYTGKPYDTATGMYNYGYRDYQPEVARFTTIDPIRDGANWFAYVNNDPVNWIDPWGLECNGTSASDQQASKSLGVFEVTAYNIAHESDYPSNQNIQAQGLGKDYNKEFLADVIMQGTGVDNEGKYITIDWFNGGAPSTPDKKLFTYTDGVYGASGRKLEPGVSIAVDPSVIPLGTWVNIEGLGRRRADDTGGAITGNKIDVFMDVPKAEALDFGRQKLNVTKE